MEPALSIPEIRRHLCLFIRPSDYRACSLVSRAWFESVAPWLWHSVSFRRSPTMDLATLYKCRVFIRALDLRIVEMPIEIFGWFDHLQAFQIDCTLYPLKAQERIANLIRRNRSSLRRIHIESNSEDSSTIVRTSHECLSLKHLHYCNIKIRERDLMESFMKTCTRLTTLSLERVELEDGIRLILKDQIFINLEQLKVDSVRGLCPDILRVCPNLKALSVRDLFDNSAEEFVETITVHCKQLCVLRCVSCSTHIIGGFAKLALTMSPLRYLQVMHSNMFQYTPYTSYSHHYETLQAVQMWKQTNGYGNDAQTVLRTCPNLRWFEGEFIYAEDIKSGSPWVCLKLEHLKIEILMRNNNRRLDSVACAQLSQLKRLRTLNLSTTDLSYRWAHDSRSLSLRLGEGLELLASLSELEHFGIGYFQVLWRAERQAEWRAEDIEWMAQAWPNLKAIYGAYLQREGMYSRLCKQMGVSRVRQHFPRIFYMDFIDL